MHNCETTSNNTENTPLKTKTKTYKTCGAKLRSGQSCAKPPVKGEKRCRLHGGITKTAGAESVTSNPGGIYSKFYTAEELANLQSMELGNVDFELQLARTQLARAMKLADLDAAGELPMSPVKGRPTSHELAARIERSGAGGASEERQYRKIDYRTAMAMALKRVESLERTRAELAKLAKEDGAAQKAPAVLMTRVITK